MEDRQETFFEKIEHVLLGLFLWFICYLLISFLLVPILWGICGLFGLPLIFQHFPFAIELYLAAIYFLWGALFRHQSKYTFLITLLLPLVVIHLPFPVGAIDIATILGAYAGKQWGFRASVTNTLIQDLRHRGTFITILLIFFAILGTFCIPYTVPGSSEGLNTSITKEAAAIISGAFQAAQKKQLITSNTDSKDLTPYMVFVSVDTTTNYGIPSASKPNWWENLGKAPKLPDNRYKGEPLEPCNSKLPCLKLHNGGILQYDASQTFSGTATTNAIVFNLDPDGPGQQGRISFYQYADGGLTTGGHPRPNTIMAPSTLTVQKKDPDYLPHWD